MNFDRAWVPTIMDGRFVPFSDVLHLLRDMDVVTFTAWVSTTQVEGEEYLKICPENEAGDVRAGMWLMRLLKALSAMTNHGVVFADVLKILQELPENDPLLIAIELGPEFTGAQLQWLFDNCANGVVPMLQPALINDAVGGVSWHVGNSPYQQMWVNLLVNLLNNIAVNDQAVQLRLAV